VAEAIYTVQDDRAEWSGRTLRGWVDDLVDAVAARFNPAEVRRTTCW
jgi:hypothetical protein